MTSNNNNNNHNLTSNMEAAVPSPVKIHISGGLMAVPPTKGKDLDKVFRHHHHQTTANVGPAGFDVSSTGFDSLHPAFGSQDDHQTIQQQLAMASQNFLYSARTQFPVAAAGAAATAMFYPSQNNGGSTSSTNFELKELPPTHPTPNAELLAVLLDGNDGGLVSRPWNPSISSAFESFQPSQNVSAGWNLASSSAASHLFSVAPTGTRGLQKLPAVVHTQGQDLESSAEVSVRATDTKKESVSLKRHLGETGSDPELLSKKQRTESAVSPVRSTDLVVSHIVSLKARKKSGKEDAFATFLASFPPDNKEYYSLFEIVQHAKCRDDSPLYKKPFNDVWKVLEKSAKIHPKLSKSHLQVCFGRFNKSRELPPRGARYAKEHQQMKKEQKVDLFLAAFPELPNGFFDSGLAILFSHFKTPTSPIFGVPAWDLGEILKKKGKYTLSGLALHKSFLNMVEFDQGLRVLSMQFFPGGLCDPLLNELSLYCMVADPRVKEYIYLMFSKYGLGWIPQPFLRRFCDALEQLCYKATIAGVI